MFNLKISTSLYAYKCVARDPFLDTSQPVPSHMGATHLRHLCILFPLFKCPCYLCNTLKYTAVASPWI